MHPDSSLSLCQTGSLPGEYHINASVVLELYDCRVSFFCSGKVFPLFSHPPEYPHLFNRNRVLKSV